MTDSVYSFKSKNYLMYSIFSLIFFACIFLLSGCFSSSNALQQWNNTDNFKTITSFVDDVSNEKSANYVPEDDRVAVFDMDGTILLEKDESNNDYWAEIQIAKNVISKYKASDLKAQEILRKYNTSEQLYYKDPDKYTSEYYNDYDSLIIEAFEGFTPTEINQYISNETKGSFNDKYSFSDVCYQPMVELIHYLNDKKFDIYFVSASNKVITYGLLSTILNNDKYNVRFDHCLGMNVATNVIENGKNLSIKYSDKIDSVSYSEYKCKQIAQFIKDAPILGFGNTSGDTQMLKYVKSNPKYKNLSVVINHDDEQREHVYNKEKMSKLCEQNDWLCVSMKDDFKTILKQ